MPVTSTATFAVRAPASNTRRLSSLNATALVLTYISWIMTNDSAERAICKLVSQRLDVPVEVDQEVRVVGRRGVAERLGTTDKPIAVALEVVVDLRRRDRAHRRRQRLDRREPEVRARSRD